MSEWAYFIFFCFVKTEPSPWMLSYFPCSPFLSHIILMVFSSFSVIEWSKVLVSVIACDKVIWALMPDNVGYQSFKHPQKPYCNNVTVTYQTLPCYCNKHNPTPLNISQADPAKWATIHHTPLYNVLKHPRKEVVTKATCWVIFVGHFQVQPWKTYVMTERINIWECKGNL